MNKLEELILNSLRTDEEETISEVTSLIKDLLLKFANFLYEEPNFNKWGQGKTDSKELLNKFLENYGK